MEEKKMDNILSQLDTILLQLKDLNTRMEKLEGKTNDIHHFVPFVGWLEDQGKRLVNMAYLPGLSYFRNKEEEKQNITYNIDDE